MLRVPCLPSGRHLGQLMTASQCRPRGFWRSSVRGPGPPGAICSRFSDRRRRACGDCLANESTVVSLWQCPDAFALRVARPGSRTRCGPSVANCTTGVRGEAPPPVGNADEASASIPRSAADLLDIAVNDNSVRRDV